MTQIGSVATCGDGRTGLVRALLIEANEKE